MNFAWVFTACVAGEEFSLEMSAANLHLLLLADQRVEHDDEGEQVEVHQEAELQEHGGNSALVGRQLAPPQLRLSVSTRSPSNRHNFRGRSGEQGWTCVCARLTEHPWKRNRADATERNRAEVKEEKPRKYLDTNLWIVHEVISVIRPAQLRL